MTNIIETVKQAAREAAAKRREADGYLAQAEVIRSGHGDDRADATDAILGALAALEAVRPVIRQETVREEQERVAKLMLTAICASRANPNISQTERNIIEYALTGLCRVVAPQHVGILALAEQETSTAAEPKCHCMCPEPDDGVALISASCPVHQPRRKDSR